MNVRALIMAGCLLTFGLASCGGPKNETPATTDTTVAKDTMPVTPIDTMSKPTAADTAKSPVLDSAMKKADTATLLTDSAIHSSKKPVETKKPAVKTEASKTTPNNNTVGTSTTSTSAEGRRSGTAASGTSETQSTRRR